MAKIISHASRDLGFFLCIFFLFPFVFCFCLLRGHFSFCHLPLPAPAMAPQPYDKKAWLFPAGHAPGMDEDHGFLPCMGCVA
ncbi:MAG TPA: hypothetical protein DCZ10_04510 [Pelotomaculum sp.]|nr:hypothetical protein [Pelotomaculum sp.]